MDYLKDHLFEIIGLLIAYFGLVVPIFRYLNQRKLEERDKRFLNFDGLIKELVEPGKDGQVMLDRQIAVIYELRNYPKYFDLSKRMLSDLKVAWQKEDYPRIIKEIELTLEYIEYKRTSLLKRIIMRKP